ncbi:MAG: glycerophosphodiester phosphodiesterase [Planctomycetota bacterium]|nr:glycerophosphodiester phosphodiesterase [Planctomycetota bacterium]
MYLRQLQNVRIRWQSWLAATLMLSVLSFGSALQNRAYGGVGEPTERPLIIGHRGACGYLPEHTLESYTLAIQQGADFVEPDLVMTRDGVLICRHEIELSETTDVATLFPDRKKTVMLEGKPLEGWFAEDLTLAEIRTLHAKERTDFRSHSNDGKFKLVTFEEMIQLTQAQSRALNRDVGICPEVKHPSYHESIGLPFDEELLRVLAKYNYRVAESPCIIQSFEASILKRLSKRTGLRLLQLFDESQQVPGDLLGTGKTYGDLITDEGLKGISQYAWGVGPWKEIIMPRTSNRLVPPSDFIVRSHAAGLKVVIYTMRNEPSFLAEEYEGEPNRENIKWVEMGVDGFFTDFTDTAVDALRQSQLQRALENN